LSSREKKTLCLLGGVVLLSVGCATTPRVMSWNDYSRHPYTSPYLINIYRPDGGALLYFGAKHSSDSKDEQLAQIEYLWTQFKPEIAFNEGGNPPVEKTREEAITKYGEPGLIRFLAHRDGIPVESIDPTPAEEVAALQKKYALETIKMFYVLRQLSEYHSGVEGVDRGHEYLAKVLAYFNSVPGLDVVQPKSVSELSLVFARDFPKLESYENVTSAWFDPAPVRMNTTFNAISRSDSNFRDEHMLTVISQAVHARKRVFAVVGSSHVVMQEAKLRGMLNEK
jgi:hypothetical protein